jgi:hypothetical protein
VRPPLFIYSFVRSSAVLSILQILAALYVLVESENVRQDIAGKGPNLVLKNAGVVD